MAEEEIRHSGQGSQPRIPSSRILTPSHHHTVSPVRPLISRGDHGFGTSDRMSRGSACRRGLLLVWPRSVGRAGWVGVEIGRSTDSHSLSSSPTSSCVRDQEPSSWGNTSLHPWSENASSLILQAATRSVLLHPSIPPSITPSPLTTVSRAHPIFLLLVPRPNFRSPSFQSPGIGLRRSSLMSETS